MYNGVKTLIVILVVTLILSSRTSPIVSKTEDAVISNVVYNSYDVNEDVVIPAIKEVLMSEEDINLIALVTMAEAEGECEEGKRLVIDTILNRVDSEHFPDTVYNVVYQKNQFSCMWNGRTDRCVVKEDIVELVKDELKSRTNNEVMFFNTGGYSKYGVSLFQVEHHYFSKY